MPPRHLVLLFPIDQGQQIDHMIKNPPEWRLHTQIEWLDMLMIVETGNFLKLSNHARLFPGLYLVSVSVVASETTFHA